MGLILCLETATPICSVALVNNGEVLCLRESKAGNDHSALLTLFVKEVMTSVSLDLGSLDAIAVSKGPGSYTGLRIGVSAAKGYCYALDKPLIAIPTLQAMANGMSKQMKKVGLKERSLLFCPMIDARRMEVFSAVYNVGNQCIREVEAEIISEESFSAFLQENTLLFFGTGAEKTEPLLGNHPNARFDREFQHSAANLAGIAEDKYIKKEFEDVAYFEPFYLKDFVAGKPRVKGL